MRNKKQLKSDEKIELSEGSNKKNEEKRGKKRKQAERRGTEFKEEDSADVSPDTDPEFIEQQEQQQQQPIPDKLRGLERVYGLEVLRNLFDSKQPSAQVDDVENKQQLQQQEQQLAHPVPPGQLVQPEHPLQQPTPPQNRSEQQQNQQQPQQPGNRSQLSRADNLSPIYPLQRYTGPDFELVRCMFLLFFLLEDISCFS